MEISVVANMYIDVKLTYRTRSDPAMRPFVPSFARLIIIDHFLLPQDVKMPIVDPANIVAGDVERCKFENNAVRRVVNVAKEGNRRVLEKYVREAWDLGSARRLRHVTLFLLARNQNTPQHRALVLNLSIRPQQYTSPPWWRNQRGSRHHVSRARCMWRLGCCRTGTSHVGSLPELDNTCGHHGSRP